MTSPYRRPSPVVAIMMAMYPNSVTATVGQDGQLPEVHIDHEK